MKNNYVLVVENVQKGKDPYRLYAANLQIAFEMFVCHIRWQIPCSLYHGTDLLEVYQPEKK